MKRLSTSKTPGALTALLQVRLPADINQAVRAAAAKARVSINLFVRILLDTALNDDRVSKLAQARSKLVSAPDQPGSSPRSGESSVSHHV